jgi:glycosyltransferase involved in cell wall biosynthesis
MICFGLAGKGTYWRALELARGLARRGHTLTVLSTSRERTFRLTTRPDNQSGVTLIETPDLTRGPLRSGWDPYNVLARVAWQRNQHFDLVHAFESRPTAIYPALTWQRRGAKLVMDWCDWFGRGGSVEERPNPIIRTILRPVETYFEEHFRTRATGTTVINSVLRQRAIDLGVPPYTILHLPNGSDVDRLRPVPRDEARCRLGWPLDVPIIGYIGAIFWRDAHLMAQAFNLIRQREPRARLLLAGYFNIEIEKLVTAPEDVVRSGHIDYDQISLYLSACDVCWLPLCNSGANRGRFPLKLNDYMAVGRAVVTTAVGDVTELIERGQFGTACGDEPAELAEHVLALLHDRDRCELMGRYGRERAVKEFHWDQIAERLARFYQQVLQGTWPEANIDLMRKESLTDERIK